MNEREAAEKIDKMCWTHADGSRRAWDERLTACAEEIEPIIRECVRDQARELVEALENARKGTAKDLRTYIEDSWGLGREAELVSLGGELVLDSIEKGFEQALSAWREKHREG